MDQDMETALRDGALAVGCRGLTKTYGSGAAQVVALRDVDLDLRRGEMRMLVGPSGSGKTTLISIIAGILDHDAGSCTVLDRDFEDMDGRRRTLLRGKSLGFVFQHFDLLPALTAAALRSRVTSSGNR